MTQRPAAQSSAPLKLLDVSPCNASTCTFCLRNFEGHKQVSNKPSQLLSNANLSLRHHTTFRHSAASKARSTVLYNTYTTCQTRLRPRNPPTMFNGFFENIMWQLDQGVTGLVYQWNGWSTAIATALVMFLSYQIFSRTDPDTHPLLLARQAQPSPVRQPGESSVYRSHSAPHGMPLNAGLNVKDPGASKWSRGRDGDIRDVWRQAVKGTSEEGKPVGKGKILTVLGADKVIEHSLGMLHCSFSCEAKTY